MTVLFNWKKILLNQTHNITHLTSHLTGATDRNDTLNDRRSAASKNKAAFILNFRIDK